MYAIEVSCRVGGRARIFVGGGRHGGDFIGISHKPLSVRFPTMMTLLFLRILTLYQENTAIQLSLHNWLTEMREPFFRSLKTYACCADRDREGEIGTGAWWVGDIVPPLATVTVGPCTALMSVQCGRASTSK